MDVCEFKGTWSTPNRNISDTQTHKEIEWQGQPAFYYQRNIGSPVVKIIIRLIFAD